MPKSKIEAEFVKLAGLDPEEYETRQDFLTAVVVKANKFKDAVYNKLSETAQEWLNAGIKAHKAKKKLPEFPDVGAVPKDEEEDEAPKKTKKKAEAEDEEEDEAPKKKKKPAEEEEDEEEEDEKPKKKKKADPEEDEEEDEPPKKKKKAVEEDEEEDDPPKKKKKKEEPEEDEEEDEPPKKKKKKVEEEDEEEDEKPKKKKAAKDDAPPKASGIKASIKDAIIEDPEISVEALVKKLGKSGGSKVTISNIRAEFRHSLKHLKAAGHLKGIEI